MTIWHLAVGDRGGVGNYTYLRLASRPAPLHAAQYKRGTSGRL